MGSRNERNRDKFLEGPKHAAMLRAVFPQATFLSKEPKESTVHAPVNLRSLKIIFEVAALIDSGATDNFILPQVIKCFEIPTKELDKPRTIRNVDGTHSKIGEINKSVDLLL